jgi:hypothetical protein
MWASEQQLRKGQGLCQDTVTVERLELTDAGISPAIDGRSLRFA